MKFSREAGVLWMEWIFLFTLSSNEELAALSSFMSLQEEQFDWMLEILKTSLVHCNLNECYTLWSSHVATDTYWMKPVWWSRLTCFSRSFSCSSCLLYFLTLFSRSSSLCLAWFIISCLLRSNSSAESFLYRTETRITSSPQTLKLQFLSRSIQTHSVVCVVETVKEFQSLTHILWHKGELSLHWHAWSQWVIFNGTHPWPSVAMVCEAGLGICRQKCHHINRYPIQSTDLYMLLLLF